MSGQTLKHQIDFEDFEVISIKGQTKGVVIPFELFSEFQDFLEEKSDENELIKRENESVRTFREFLSES
ncbi:MAG: hypothetical protein JJT78_04245 [Leptospira sp.]|nr:hypothetical protein [Leptospira sp.]